MIDTSANATVNNHLGASLQSKAKEEKAENARSGVDQKYVGMDTKAAGGENLIRWENYTTRTIDLRVMCETDLDSFNTYLCEVPKSTQLSIIREAKGKEGDQNNETAR